MMNEHEAAGALLEEMRASTGGFTPPADACPTLVGFLDAWMPSSAICTGMCIWKTTCSFSRHRDGKRGFSCTIAPLAKLSTKYSGLGL